MTTTRHAFHGRRWPTQLTTSTLAVANKLRWRWCQLPGARSACIMHNAKLNAFAMYSIVGNFAPTRT